MKKSRWILTLTAGAVVAGLGIGAVAYLGASGVEAQTPGLPATMAWLPADASVVGHVDLTSLFASPLREKWEEQIDAQESRDDRNAHQALDKIREHIEDGYTEVYDADLKGYFDTIPHDKLMKVLEYRIADRSLVKLIRMWLRVPIVEKDDDGRPQVRRSPRGTPQGGVISPLLANAYLHWFDKVFHMRSGPRYWANARLVRYADDFVVLARYQGEQLRQFVEGTIEGWMGLTINREKTRVVSLSKGERT